jgi:hypothetical protein
VKTAVDPRLLGEVERFTLRFACDDCAHFAAERGPTCGNGWPVRLRRSDIEPGADDVAFCKEFELA